jgi:dihydrofolate reductase
MATVVCELSMSLDGYVADLNDGIDHVFDWYDAGPVEIRTAHEELTFHLTEPSAAHVRAGIATYGAFVSGRRTFDLTDGWAGRHPLDAPVVVVTHRDASEWQARYPDAPFTFTSDVPEAIAVAKSIAGDRAVGMCGPSIAQQCLAAGLLDEIVVNLAPVLLGSGIAFFGALPSAVRLSDPEVVEGTRVTHLRYRVERS